MSRKYSPHHHALLYLLQLSLAQLGNELVKINAICQNIAVGIAAVLMHAIETGGDGRVVEGGGQRLLSMKILIATSSAG
jgi:hypothetical protein